jgi:membrane protease YdiL (CAAX protease family)
MRAFFSVRFRPTAETGRAALFVAIFIVALGSLHGFVSPHFGRTVAGVLATLFYLTIFFATLSFARRRQSLAALGVTTRRWFIAVALGALVGSLGLFGTMNAFPAGHFVIPPWPSLLALLATAISVGFIEDLVFYGYFQLRVEESFGPLIGVSASSVAWTLFHAAALSTPGAGTFGAQVVGVTNFLVHLLVTFFILGLVVHVTGNIWAGVVQNAVMGNVLVNLYMMSIMPEQILIGDPASLPVALGAALLVGSGLVGSFMIDVVRQRHRPWR